MIIILGYAFAFGVFQDYYSATEPFKGSGNIAVIGTCAMVCAALISNLSRANYVSGSCIHDGPTRNRSHDTGPSFCPLGIDSWCDRDVPLLGVEFFRIQRDTTHFDSRNWIRSGWMFCIYPFDPLYVRMVLQKERSGLRYRLGKFLACYCPVRSTNVLHRPAQQFRGLFSLLL